MDAYDPVTKRWARASLRPVSESRNPEFMDRFNLLAEARPDKVEFTRANFSSPRDIQRFMEKYKGKKFPFLTIIMAAHQFSRNEFKTMDKATDEMVDEIGAKYLFDAAYYNPLTKGLQYYQDWHTVPGRFRAFIKDKTDPEGYRWRKAFDSYDSRCGILSVAGCEMVLGGRVTPTAEVLKQIG